MLDSFFQADSTLIHMTIQVTRGADGSGDCSRSTDSVVPGSIPWEIGWWAITAPSLSPWPPLEQGESSTSGGSLVK